MPITLKQALDEYEIVLVTSELSPNTVNLKRSHLRTFYKWALESKTFPHTDVSQIKPKHMREYFYFRKVVQCVGAGTRKQSHIHLNGFFKWLTKEYRKQLKKNPMDKVDRPIYNLPEVDFPDLNIIDKMIESCETDSFKGIRDRLLLLLFKQTGARAHEVLALTEYDIFEIDQYIRIRQGKGGKYREVPYGDETAIAIIAYKRVRKEHRFADSPYFFIGGRGTFKYGGLNHMFKSRSLDVSDQKITPHKFRHAFVHLAKVNKVTEDALMELLGWSTRAMLDHYGRAFRAQRAHDEYREKMQD